MKKSFTTILFDLDGTLIDTSVGIKECIKKTLAELQLPQLSSKEMDSFIGPPLQTSFETCCNIREEQARHAVDIFRSHYAQHEIFNASVYDQITELLELLKRQGYILGVATNKKDDFAFSIIQHFDLLWYFDCVCGSNAEQKSKSHIITQCCNVLKQNTNDVLYIGDTYADANAAIAAGVSFVGVSWGFGISADNNTTIDFNIINRPLELNNLL